MNNALEFIKTLLLNCVNENGCYRIEVSISIEAVYVIYKFDITKDGYVPVLNNAIIESVDIVEGVDDPEEGLAIEVTYSFPR